MATDLNLAVLFQDTYMAAGHRPHQQQQRELLEGLLANATASLAGGAAGAGAVAESLVQALQQLQPQLGPWGLGRAGALGNFSSSASPADKGGPVDIGLLGLVLATALVAVNGVVSLWLHLGLHSKLAVAAVRCIIQLLVLGYILVPIFVANRWWLTLLYTLFMLGVAAIEAVSRPGQTYGGMLPQVLLSLGIASSLVISYGLAVVVQVEPWYDAQYLIPMLGMLLGNACSGIAVGLSTVLEELSTGRDKVEMLLSMGATRMEATRDVVQRAVRMAMTPLLNQMSVVGVVSIPGMMTGQILGGLDPATAARYQIVIMFLIGATTAVASVATIFLAVLSVIDDRHRLRSERLQPKAAAGSGAVAWVQAQAKRGWDGVQIRAARLSTRLRLVFGAVTSRNRHRYLFSRAGSAIASVGDSEARAYSRVGSGAEEERDGEEGPQGQGSAGQPVLQQVLVGDSSRSGEALLGEEGRSPRQALLDGRRGTP